MEKVTLEELKKIIEQHLRKELDIMGMVFNISDSDAKEFNEWYINHPICKGIEELQRFVRHSKTNRGIQKTIP